MRRGCIEILDFKPHRAVGLAVRPFRTDKVFAHHHFRHGAGSFVFRRAFGHHLAHPHNGRRVAQSLYLFQLVRNIEDRNTFFRQAAERLEKFFNFLRRQNRRRFVHDQQGRVLQQAPHYLNPLALANRQRVHVAVGIERQPILGRNFPDSGR